MADTNSYLHIGFVGPANPVAFHSFILGAELPALHTNTTAISTYATELLRAGHCVSIFTDTYDSDSVIEFHAANLHIYIIPRDIRRMGFRSLSPLTFHVRLQRFLSGHLHDIDVLHAQWTYEYALAAKRFANRIPVFCTVRDWCPYIYSIQNARIEKIRWMIYLLVFHRVMRGNQLHFIANSDYTYQQLHTAYPKKEVSIIYNPIDKEAVLDHPKKAVDHPIFISICYIISDIRKNISILLDAFYLFRQRHRDAELLLVGDYQKDLTVYHYAQNNHLTDGVRFLGSIPHEQLIYVLDKATCLVHPSIEETFGNTLLEGMSRCIPCIGGEQSGAVPQVLGHGECGILCDIHSAESLCAAMETAQDYASTAKLVHNATERINHLFRSDITMQQTIDLYLKYLKHS